MLYPRAVDWRAIARRLPEGAVTALGREDDIASMLDENWPLRPYTKKSKQTKRWAIAWQSSGMHHGLPDVPPIKDIISYRRAAPFKMTQRRCSYSTRRRGTLRL